MRSRPHAACGSIDTAWFSCTSWSASTASTWGCRRTRSSSVAGIVAVNPRKPFLKWRCTCPPRPRITVSDSVCVSATSLERVTMYRSAMGLAGRKRKLAISCGAALTSWAGALGALLCAGTLRGAATLVFDPAVASSPLPISVLLSTPQLVWCAGDPASAGRNMGKDSTDSTLAFLRTASSSAAGIVAANPLNPLLKYW